MNYLPSRRHGQFTATPHHERLHDASCPCMYEADMLTAGERKRGRRKVLDNRRSVFLMSALSSGQQKRRTSRRKRGA